MDIIVVSEGQTTGGTPQKQGYRVLRRCCIIHMLLFIFKQIATFGNTESRGIRNQGEVNKCGKQNFLKTDSSETDPLHEACLTCRFSFDLLGQLLKET